MEAKRHFNKALSIDSAYQPSIYGLGLVLYYHQDYGLAISEFKRSLNLYPKHLNSHFGIGKSYFYMRLYSKAIAYLKYFAEVDHDDPEVHGLLGMCYEKTGDIELAVREYRYQVEVAPNTKLGLYAKRKLAVLEPLLLQ